MAKFESKILAMKQVIFVKGANDVVKFYKAVFGAEEVKKAQEMKRPFVVSAEMKLAGYTLFISDDTSAALGVGGSVFVLELETGDVEHVVERAVGEGAEVAEVADGARVRKLKDPYGNLWIISSPAAVKQVVDFDIGSPSASDYIITPRSAAESYLAYTAIHEEENAAAAAACSQEWVR